MEEHRHHEHHSHHGHHGQKAKEESITITKTTLWKIGTFVFAALFVLSLFTGGFGFGTGDGANNGGNQPVAAPTEPGPTGSIKVNVDKNSDPILGNDAADISIVEFSDFQCPFCSRAADGAVADFKKSDYYSKGQVNLVYKHFPLNSIHPQAQKAAEASECARLQGNDKFWEYHDLLFANQGALTVNDLKSYASQIGLNSGEFNSCLDGNRARTKVSKDLDEATSAGGRGTPYFVVINHKTGKTSAVSGAVPYSQIDSAISSVL